MNRSKLLGKKDRPLEKGQQTLTALFSNAKSIQTRSKCSICLQQIRTPQLATHQKNCTVAGRKPVLSKEDDDSDIEIIQDATTLIKKPIPPKLKSASTKDALGAKKGTAESVISATGSSTSVAGSSVDATGSSLSVTGSSTSISGSSLNANGPSTNAAVSSTNGTAGYRTSAPDSTSGEAKPSTSGAAESIDANSTPCSSTPCKDDIPPWGRDSPQITDVVGGDMAIAFCETAWSHSDSTSERSEPDTPSIRCKVVGVGGWLVSPARSPSVSPGGRVLPSPGDVTPGGPVTVSEAGQLVPPGSRVKLSPAVAGRTGRFAHSALLSEHLPPPTSPALSQKKAQSKTQNQREAKGRSQSPRQSLKQSLGQNRAQSVGKSPGRNQGKSPRRSPWNSPGAGKRPSPAQSPSRRLPRTNPLRYLNSPSGVRRRLYGADAGEGPSSTASTAGTSTGSTTASASGSTGAHGSELDLRSDTGRDRRGSSAAGKGVAGEAGRAKRKTEEAEDDDAGRSVAGGPAKPGESSDGRGKGLVKLAKLCLLRCDSQERLIGNFAIDSDNSAPCSPISIRSFKDHSAAPSPQRDRMPPSVTCETVQDSNSVSTVTSTTLTRSSTPTPTPAVDLDLSAEEEELLSQEFNSEMPEVALLSPKKQPDATRPYYLQNFIFILDSVLSDAHHSPLLNDEDRGVISRLRELPPSAQMLYVRMFQRKHAWLRPEKLRYPEVGDETAVGTALDQLTSAGLLDTERELSGAVELAELLSAPELRQLCQQLHLTTTGPRPELLARLAQLGKKRGAAMFGAASPAQVAARRARTLLGRCVRVSSGPRGVFLRVLSLFHLPLHEDDEDTSQQLLTLLMVNLGRMVYPAVTVTKQTRIFVTRDDLLRYEAASQIERQLRVAMETKQWDAAYDAYQAAKSLLISLSRQPELERYDATLPAFLRRFTASSIITYVLSKSVEVLQRRREHDAAVTLLRDLLAQQDVLARLPRLLGGSSRADSSSASPPASGGSRGGPGSPRRPRGPRRTASGPGAARGPPGTLSRHHASSARRPPQCGGRGAVPSERRARSEEGLPQAGASPRR